MLVELVLVIEPVDFAVFVEGGIFALGYRTLCDFVSLVASLFVLVRYASSHNFVLLVHQLGLLGIFQGTVKFQFVH